MKEPLTKSGARWHIIGVIIGLICIIWLLPQVINEWGKPAKTEQRIVKVQKHYHWTPTGIRQIPTGDPNIFMGVAEYDNSPPTVTILKEGEEIDQENNWETLEKAQNDYFNK
jgi:uncharacterized membrane protein